MSETRSDFDDSTIFPNEREMGKHLHHSPLPESPPTEKEANVYAADHETMQQVIELELQGYPAAKQITHLRVMHCSMLTSLQGI